MSSIGALLQLASPALPIGAFSYSQGLESAIECGMVNDESSAMEWMRYGLTAVLANYEAPVWLRLHRSVTSGDIGEFSYWNAEFMASRESAELRSESAQMGYSLARLMSSLGHDPPLSPDELSYPAAYAHACHCWAVNVDAGLAAYLYGWCENQVTCAMKSIPLGQTAGQRILVALRSALTRACETAAALEDDELSTLNPMLAILASQHEVQYSRLFRS